MSAAESYKPARAASEEGIGEMYKTPRAGAREGEEAEVGAGPLSAAAALKALLERTRDRMAAAQATSEATLAATPDGTAKPTDEAAVAEVPARAGDGAVEASPYGTSAPRVTAPGLPPAQYDAQNRRMCGARRRGEGEPCRAPAMRGQARCKMHGGAAPQAKAAGKLRLAALVEPAIGTLAREMVRADKSADRQRAANSILDRAGFARERTVNTSSDASREMLLERLRALRDEAKARDVGELEVLDAEVVDEDES